jgi:hypothetical protein
LAGPLNTSAFLITNSALVLKESIDEKRSLVHAETESSFMDAEYSRDTAAAFALLQEVTGALLECDVDFVIVGGWVPFLFHAQRFGHPGTYDVDVLLNAKSLDDGTFELAAERLLDIGYLRAVKNKFQAHRIIRVLGEDLVFHADFLNERNLEDELNLVGGRGILQSIYTPAMKAVFKYAGYRTHPTLPGVRFPSVETFIVTKAIATTVKKRFRDAFDIFVTVADQDPSDLKLRWSQLMADGLFQDANQVLWTAIHSGDALAKIEVVLHELSPRSRPSEDQVRLIFDFLVKPAGVSD